MTYFPNSLGARIFITAVSIALPILAVSIGVSISICPSRFAPVQSQLALWAWDTPEDLLFLKDEQTSVSYYAGTIIVRNGTVLFRPRNKVLKTPEGLSLCPVFRIENLSTSPPSHDAVTEISELIAAHVEENDSVNKRVQIDFDATTSDRPFYLRLLSALRQRLPIKTHIAITALASWAMGDRWLPRGSADEAIVMLFSMGNTNDILKSIGRWKLSVGDGIETSIGISVNEPLTNDMLSRLKIIQTAQTLYLFNSHPWKRDRYLEAKKLISTAPQSQ
ncbi:MAG: DUF3142 domain-containing protein [Candidatus Obscuribacterales bacterium]|nr:DUF3142 domain-containing protein [Candidatus Obscuribacterales bacterium]